MRWWVTFFFAIYRHTAQTEQKSSSRVQWKFQMGILCFGVLTHSWHCSVMCWGATKSSAVFHVNRVSRILQLGTLWFHESHFLMLNKNIPYSLSFLKRTILCFIRHFDHFSKSKIYERYTRNKFLMYTSHYEISTKYPLNEPNSFCKKCGDWVTSKSNLPDYLQQWLFLRHIYWFPKTATHPIVS